MHAYEFPAISNLAEQLKRGPGRLRLKQLNAITFLLTVVDERKAYPFDFIRHTLTGYRRAALTALENADETDEAVLDGSALREDLVALAEDLSEHSAIELHDWPWLVFTVSELADRFGVSTKTIFRWRRRGLVGWKFIGDDRRPRLAFTDAAVRRFVAENVELVNRGSSFSQLTKAERERVVERAKELVAAGERTVNSVAKVISSELNRAVETVRLILKHYDEAHPRAGLFNRVAPNMPADDGRLAVWEAYVDGASVETLARRFDRPARQIYATITVMRAHALKAESIDHVPSDEFAEPAAEQEILSDADARHPYDENTRTDSKRLPPGLPAYLQQLFYLPLLRPQGERALFRQMNFLKYQAEQRRAALEPEDATAQQLDAIDDLLERANDIKNRIIQANLRLVVSIAKRHATPEREFFEVVSDGNISLMRAVDKFDYSRGFKFSTYASWAIMKNYARSRPEQRRHQERYQTGRDELLGVVPSPALDEHEFDELPVVRSRVDRMLAALDQREQDILRQRYGLDRDGQPQTLEAIGQRFGVSKERIRQLEARAISKLRSDFEDAAEQVLSG